MMIGNPIIIFAWENIWLLQHCVIILIRDKKKWKLTFKFCPSNGRDPLTNVYKITPKLQTSTSGPSYFFP